MCLKVATVGTCMNMYESDDETHSDAETSDYSDDEWIENVHFEMFLIFGFWIFEC